MVQKANRNKKYNILAIEVKPSNVCKKTTSNCVVRAV